MSVNTVSALERSMYNDEFRTDFEREKSLLMKAVRSDGLMKAGTIYWDVTGLTDESAERGRDGSIPVSNLADSQVSDTPKEFFKKYRIDDFDAFKTNPNYRAQQYRKVIAASYRKIDNRIISILDTSTNVQNSSSAIDFGAFGPLLTWTAALWSNDVPNDGRVWAAVTPNALAQMMTISEFKNADFVNTKKVEAGSNGYGENGYWNWLGVKWFMHTGLTGIGTSTADCWMWHEDAVAHQVAGEPEVHMYYYEPEDRWEVWGKVRSARALPLPRGVQGAVHDDTATIA
jgi:hypothetical protein